MKYFWLILFTLLVDACKSPNQTENQSSRDSMEVEFSFEETPVDFEINDSAGYSITFTKDKDSSFYHTLRFRTPESQEMLKPALPVLDRLWAEAEKEIATRLTSINVGYPLEYNDILTSHIQAFSSSGLWGDQLLNSGEDVDYRLVEEVMMKNEVYPLDGLLKDFGYRASGYSIEKVGFVEPSRLIGLGFDEALRIPVPYMVWIRVEKIR